MTTMAVEGAAVVILSETFPELPDPWSFPKTQAAPFGNPLHANLKVLPSNPESARAVVPDEPGASTETVVGLAVIFGVAGVVVGADFFPGLMPTQSVMVWTRLPLVAKIVIGTLSAFAEE